MNLWQLYVKINAHRISLLRKSIFWIEENFPIGFPYAVVFYPAMRVSRHCNRQVTSTYSSAARNCYLYIFVSTESAFSTSFMVIGLKNIKAKIDIEKLMITILYLQRLHKIWLLWVNLFKNNPCQSYIIVIIFFHLVFLSQDTVANSS